MKGKIINLATSVGFMIRSLPIVLGIILCAVIGFAGVGIFSWAVNFITEVAETNAMVFVCMGVLLLLSVKTKMVFALHGLFGVVAIAFSGWFMARILSSTIGWFADAINDLSIPLMIILSGAAAVGVYKDDLLRIADAAQNEQWKGFGSNKKNRGNS